MDYQKSFDFNNQFNQEPTTEESRTATELGIKSPEMPTLNAETLKALEDLRNQNQKTALCVDLFGIGFCSGDEEESQNGGFFNISQLPNRPQRYEQTCKDHSRSNARMIVEKIDFENNAVLCATNGSGTFTFGMGGPGVEQSSGITQFYAPLDLYCRRSHTGSPLKNHSYFYKNIGANNGSCIAQQK